MNLQDVIDSGKPFFCAAIDFGYDGERFWIKEDVHLSTSPLFIFTVKIYAENDELHFDVFSLLQSLRSFDPRSSREHFTTSVLIFLRMSSRTKYREIKPDKVLRLE